VALFGGIDAGKKGFASLIEDRQGLEVVDCHEQPLVSDARGDQADIHAMSDILSGWKAVGVRLVVLEHQDPPGGPRKKTNAHAVWHQAGFWWLWRGLLAAHRIRHQVVKDTVWKKLCGVPSPTRTAKKPEPAKPAKPKRGDYPDRASHLEALEQHADEIEEWKKAKKEYDREDGRRLRANKKLVKAEAIKVCRGLFPDVDLRRNARCKVPDDNKAESLLLALCASRLDSGIGA
jgi:hypothetical protein